MIDVLNLALPYFGLIFIGFACGKAKGLPEAGLAWMNFFLLYVSLPALLYGIMSKTPFEELNNPPFLIATTLRDDERFRAGDAGRPVDRAAVVSRGHAGGPFRRLWQYRLYGPRSGAGRAGDEGRRADRADLLLRQHLPVFDRAAVDCVDRSPAPIPAAHARARGAADRFQSADHVGLRRSAGGGAPSSSARRDRQYAVVSAKRRGAGGAVCAGRDGRAASVRPRALGSSRRHRGQTADPSADGFRIDDCCWARSRSHGRQPLC